MSDLKGGYFDTIRSISFSVPGYLLVGIFLTGWTLSAVLWKLGGFEARRLPAVLSIRRIGEAVPDPTVALDGTPQPGGQSM